MHVLKNYIQWNLKMWSLFKGCDGISHLPSVSLLSLQVYEINSKDKLKVCICAHVISFTRTPSRTMYMHYLTVLWSVQLWL